MPKWAAILLTGLIFAVVHGNIYQECILSLPVFISDTYMCSANRF